MAEELYKFPICAVRGLQVGKPKPTSIEAPGSKITYSWTVV